jgi:hypothetical protein
VNLPAPRIFTRFRSTLRLLFIFVFVIFVLSRWIAIGTMFRGASHKFIFAISAGVFWASEPFGPIAPWETSSFETQVREIAETSRIGIVQPPHWVAWPSPTPLGPRRWLVRAPLWIILVVLTIPVLALGRNPRRLPLPGHCCRCNYDLTGNVSGVCPECGPN